MTLPEKISQMMNDCARHRAARRPGLQLVERSAARRRRAPGVATVFPQAIGLAATWDTDLIHRDRRRHLRRGARQVQRRHRATATTSIYLRPHLLVAQHQYLPRSALGTRAGDLRRRSLPDRPAWRRLHQGHAGRRSALPQGRRDRQALRRPQRPRSRCGTLRRRVERRTTCTIPICPRFEAAVREGKADSVMCAYNRVNGVPACANRPAARTSCASSGASTATWSPTAARSATSSAATTTPTDAAEGRGGRRQGGLRPGLRRRLPGAGRGGERRA